MSQQTTLSPGADTLQKLDVKGILKERYTAAEIASFEANLLSPFEKILAKTAGVVRDKISEIAVKQLMEDLSPLEKQKQYKSLKETLDKVFESYSKFPEDRFQTAIADQKNKLLLMVKTEIPQYEMFVFNDNLRNLPSGPTGSIRSSGMAGGLIGAVLGGAAGSRAGSDFFRATAPSARREMDPQVEANLKEMVANVVEKTTELKQRNIKAIANGSSPERDFILREATRKLMDSVRLAGREYGMDSMTVIRDLAQKMQNPNLIISGLQDNPYTRFG